MPTRFLEFVVRFAIAIPFRGTWSGRLELHTDIRCRTPDIRKRSEKQIPRYARDDKTRGCSNASGHEQSFGPRERILQTFDFGAQVVGALGDGNIEKKEHAPANEVCRKHAVQVFHCASASLRRISTCDLIFSSM